VRDFLSSCVLSFLLFARELFRRLRSCLGVSLASHDTMLSQSWASSASSLALAPLAHPCHLGILIGQPLT
jgi:hypothetical protein